MNKNLVLALVASVGGYLLYKQMTKPKTILIAANPGALNTNSNTSTGNSGWLFDAINTVESQFSGHMN